MHLTLDGLTREPATYAQVREWLVDTPELIGMTPIRDSFGNMRLFVTRIGFQLHGVAFIAESHLAVHTHERIISIDVFSCKPFDDFVVIQRAIDHFGLLPGWRVHLDPERLTLTPMGAPT